ncbi:MAG: membrane protein insertase YidC [Deltaproteobacteria bacterium]|nr:membrane protein insertase YidC [Deltaproteobacteria bacterium]
MEQARIFIAILLSFLVFFVWEMFFGAHEAVRPPVAQPAGQAETSTGKPSPENPVEQAGSRTAQTTPADMSGAAATAQPALAPAARTIRVETPYYRLVIDERGGTVRSVELRKYRQSVGKDAPAYRLVGEDLAGGTLQLTLSPGDAEAAQAVFNADTQKDNIVVDQGPQSLVLTHWRSDGIGIEKRFTFRPDSYLIDLDVTLKNNGTKVSNPQLRLALLQQEEHHKGRSYGFSGPSVLLDDRLSQIDLDDIEDQNLLEGKVGWIAIQDRYFLSALVPPPVAEATVQLAHQDAVIQNALVLPAETLAPGQARTYTYRVFFGPKRGEVLKTYGLELERAVHFGMFDFIAKPCLWFMNWIYGFIPNYGIAIIILTILTKVLLWPLGNKSYKSMSEMRRMQPLMAEIREKYKNDKKKMNEEMMNLYRVYKVNPLGGCLPMLVQLPVFFALYRMLYEAIELRHAPFFGWINDLSAPDRLFSFDFSIPLMEPPYGIPVLTIIMGATMFLQQKMTPTPGDPTQAKMMTFMPLIFTFIFINFSSGLVLYWLVNNLASIAQQYYVYKKA